MVSGAQPTRDSNPERVQCNKPRRIRDGAGGVAPRIQRRGKTGRRGVRLFLRELLLKARRKAGPDTWSSIGGQRERGEWPELVSQRAGGARERRWGLPPKIKKNHPIIAGRGPQR